jgi:hypothetical protein
MSPETAYDHHSTFFGHAIRASHAHLTLLHDSLLLPFRTSVVPQQGLFLSFSQPHCPTILDPSILHTDTMFVTTANARPTFMSEGHTSRVLVFELICSEY